MKLIVKCRLSLLNLGVMEDTLSDDGQKEADSSREKTAE
jgi:hypothetical protein